jgi:hypothetical protein
MYMFVFGHADEGRFMIGFFNPFDRHQRLPEIVSLAMVLIDIGVCGYQLDIVFLLLPLMYYWYQDYVKRKIDFNYLLLAWVALVPHMFVIRLDYDQHRHIDMYEFVTQLAIWLRILVAAVVTGLSLYKLARSGFSAKI